MAKFFVKKAPKIHAFFTKKFAILELGLNQNKGLFKLKEKRFKLLNQKSKKKLLEFMVFHGPVPGDTQENIAKHKLKAILGENIQEFDSF